MTDMQQATILQDLIAGGIAGSCSVFVGHPLDTYKVMLQTSTQSVQKRSLSISRLYRGIMPPLASAGVVNAIIFGSFGESSRLWDEYVSQDKHNNGKKGVEISDIPSWQKSFICGSFAGAVQSFVICPTEHIKCRLQMIQHATIPAANSQTSVYKGSFDAFNKIMSSHGLRGLYRGLGCTACREVPSFGLYFSSYEYVKGSVSSLLLSSRKQSSANIDGRNIDSSHVWAVSALAGGLSGAIVWFATYPFDLIKTKIQTLPLDTPLERRRISYIYQQTLDRHGWRIFFRGLGVTILRAFPVNAIIFPVYELTLQLLASEKRMFSTTSTISSKRLNSIHIKQSPCINGNSLEDFPYHY